VLPRFAFALLLWFMLLICAFPAFVERAEAQEADRELDLSQGPAQEPGLTQPDVDYVEHRYADDGGSYVVDYPNYLEGYINPDANDQASALNSTNNVLLDDSSAGSSDFDVLDSDSSEQLYGITHEVNIDSQANTQAALLNSDNNASQDNYPSSEGVDINSVRQPSETLQDIEYGPQINTQTSIPDSTNIIISDFDGLEDGAGHSGLANKDDRSVETSQYVSISPDASSQASVLSTANDTSSEAGYADDSNYRANYPSDLDSRITAWEEANSGVLDSLKETKWDPEPTTAALHRANNEAYVVQPNSIDYSFIRHQEGFRLGGYVPDPEFSRSGVTIGTGVDIGQLSVADIEAFDIPRELKQKLKPYAGLIRQDAVYFLNNHPLHLTEDEAYTLDRVKTQDIIDGVTNRYNAAASGKLFTELPPEAQTVMADIAFQYRSKLEHRMPNFWSDVTEGRWKSVVQKLRNFGDRYPTRRSAEADLLERAIDRGDLGAYVVQPGDTLAEIASRLEIPIEYLVAHNDITDPDIVYSGQVLYH
jgi:hypothetical protein